MRLKPRLLQHLQFLRDGWGQSIVVTSGYRCQAHNAAVGGTARYRRLLGGAVDVKIPAALQQTFCNLAVRCGFAKALSHGERNFVHLEV